MIRRSAVRGQNTVTNEPVADARPHGSFFQPLRQGEASCDGIRRGFFCNNHFEKFHHMSRGKEVQPYYVFRSLCCAGDLVDVEIGCIGGQYRAGFADRIQP